MRAVALPRFVPPPPLLFAAPRGAWRNYFASMVRHCPGLPPAFCRTPAPPNPANMATTTEAARPKREAKAVEHFTIESKEVDPDDLKIKAGGGAKFGDVENIVFKIAKLNAQVRLLLRDQSPLTPNPNPKP